MSDDPQWTGIDIQRATKSLEQAAWVALGRMLMEFSQLDHNLAMALVVHAVQVIIPAFLGMVGIYVMGENLSSLVRSARKTSGMGELE